MSYSCVTTVLSGAGSQSLTDLATAKMELAIATNDTSKDAWLTMAIGQVSAAIGTYCKRRFAPEQVQDTFDVQQDPYPYQTPGGFPQLELSRWPVLNVASVVQTITPGSGGTTQALYAGKDYRLDPDTGRLLRLSPFTGVGTLWEALPVTVVYTSGFGGMVQETSSVPASAPYRITVAQAANFSCDIAVAYANGVALVPVTGSPAQGQYSVSAGIYTFATADEGQSLAFTYATVSIPLDLVEVCLRMITARFSARGRDPTLIQTEQPNVGTRRYWFGGAPGQSGAFAPDIEAILDTYRMPTLA